MNRKILSGIVIAMVLLLASARRFRSQDMPEPPDPPDPPDAPEMLVLNGGYPQLGVTLGEVTAEKAQELKLPTVAGAVVASVASDSPAAKAGIEKDDVIVEFDGVHVRSSAELRRLVRETPAGRAVAVKVMRGGKVQILSAKLEAHIRQNFTYTAPEIHLPAMNFPDVPFLIGFSRILLGISGDDLTTQLAQYFGVKQGTGVLVREVTVGSSAEKAGLKAGDVIVQVDGKTVAGVNELRKALNPDSADDTRKVSLTIVRDHHEQTVSVELKRSAPPERHAARASMTGMDPAALERLRQQGEQIREEAEQLRSEMEQQKELMRGEWQRQLREQSREVREQLKNLPKRSLPAVGAAL
jgi:serine protease Do